jgi:hypothetical protein
VLHLHSATRVLQLIHQQQLDPSLPAGQTVSWPSQQQQQQQAADCRAAVSWLLQAPAGSSSVQGFQTYWSTVVMCALPLLVLMDGSTGKSQGPTSCA